MPESAISNEAPFNLEKIGDNIIEENGDELFRRAEDINSDLKKLKILFHDIDMESVSSYYEAMTPEYASYTVAEKIEKIPLDSMHGALWTVDNLREFGGKIIHWASINSYENLDELVASVMILTVGNDNLENTDGDAAEKAELAPGDSASSMDENRAENGLAMGEPVHSQDVHKRIIN